MKKTLHWSSLFGVLLFATACVTINVYFPTAEAVEAADKIIRGVYGEEAPATTPPAETQPDTSSHVMPTRQPLLIGVLEWMVPAAHAGANIDIASPAVRRRGGHPTHRGRASGRPHPRGRCGPGDRARGGVALAGEVGRGRRSLRHGGARSTRAGLARLRGRHTSSQRSVWLAARGLPDHDPAMDATSRSGTDPRRAR